LSKLVLIDDSDLIIKGLCGLIKNAHPTLAMILLRIKDLKKKIEVNYFHVYHL
jgi:hypothetical protein